MSSPKSHPAPLPAVIPVHVLTKWLPEIFGAGTPHRNYLVREMAAKTLFTMLYVGAVEGCGRWLRPDQVTKMTDAQAEKTDASERIAWTEASLTPGAMKSVVGRWYAVNTREPIRDETLRSGLVGVGAVVERKDLPTTSASPRYAIARHFAALVAACAEPSADPSVAIRRWQEQHLSASSLTRLRLLNAAAVPAGAADRVSVAFPNGEVRLLRPGPSSAITKAVIEQFAPQFLREPGVVLVSESGDKVVARDAALMKSLKLEVDAARNLPDLILADVSVAAPKLVFVEVVASDGAVTELRKSALLEVAHQAGHAAGNVFFVSAFLDRDAAAFRKLVSSIAWGTFAWFASEPDKLLAFRNGSLAERRTLLER